MFVYSNIKFTFVLEFKTYTMEHILYLALLGLIAGSLSGLWTRIIRTGMIFEKIGKKLVDDNYNYWYLNSHSSPWVKFLKCIFCLHPWIFFLFALFYVIEFHPPFIYAIIGILGGVGAGNFMAELIYSLRGER